jgi:hypothetical protein
MPVRIRYFPPDSIQPNLVVGMQARPRNVVTLTVGVTPCTWTPLWSTSRKLTSDGQGRRQIVTSDSN